MEKLHFKRLVKQNSNYTRARALYIGKTTTDNLVGNIYLNYNETYKNKEVYELLNEQQRKEVDTFIREYNQERRLLMMFTNEKYNKHDFYISDRTVKMINELESLNKIRPLNLVINQAIQREILTASEKDEEVRDICESYGYDYLQLANFKKKKNVFSVDFEQVKKIIDLFLSLDSDKQNIINNLNDHLALKFNTDKQFTLEQIERMNDPNNNYFAKAYLLGAMLDVIYMYGLSPIGYIDIEVVFFYWYQIRLLHYSENKALKEFVKYFELQESKFLEIFDSVIHDPLVELMTREMSDKYIGIM